MDIMENKTTKSKPTLITYLLAGIGVLAVAGILIAVITNSGSQAGTGLTVDIDSDSGTFTAQVPDDYEVSGYKYVIVEGRDDCNAQAFENNGQDATANLSDIVYSQSWTPTAGERSAYHEKWLCFAARHVSGGQYDAGSWHRVTQELDLVTPGGSPVDPVDDPECPEGTIWDSGCVEPAEEGEPCDLHGIGDSEGRCVPCPTDEGYAIINNSCVPSDGESVSDPVDPVDCPEGQVEKAGQCVDPCVAEEGDNNTYVLIDSTCVDTSEALRALFEALDCDYADVDTALGIDGQCHIVGGDYE